MAQGAKSKSDYRSARSSKLNIHKDPVPLRVDLGGAIRVGPSRVTLATVIGSYVDGAKPEQIVDDFPTLQLEDVYSVIGYYLRHRDEVNAFLQWEEEEGERLLKEIEAHQDPLGEVRTRLKARLTAQGS